MAELPKTSIVAHSLLPCLLDRDPFQSGYESARSIEVDGLVGKRRRVGELVVLHHPLGLLNTLLRGKQACSPRAPTKIADKKSPLIERAFYFQS
jgi:hypothetical protein